MHALVTGAAGFIGSHLAEALVADGHRVRGVDCFTSHYDPETKRANVTPLSCRPEFSLVEADLRSADLRPLLDGVDVVFHLAGQPGIRPSWSAFSRYTELNILVTQRLLEAATQARAGRIVFASSSSVYGNAPSYPTHEDDLPRPHNPYGVTKLAAEHLCRLYAENYGLPTVSLRYFTVYGPRQRPDMGLARFCRCALAGVPIPVFGSGDQVRDVTYVSDAVAATVSAASADVAPGTAINVAGGTSVSINDLLGVLAELVGRDLRRDRLPAQPGDVAATSGATGRALELLGWVPRVGLRQGLAAQLAWHRSVDGPPPPERVEGVGDGHAPAAGAERVVHDARSQ